MNRFYKFKDGRLLDITSIISINLRENIEKTTNNGYKTLYYISIAYINYKILLSGYVGNTIVYKGLLWSRLNHNDLDDSLESSMNLMPCEETIDKADVSVSNMSISFTDIDERETELVKLSEYIKLYYNEL